MTPRHEDALLLVDLQADCMPGGALPVAGCDEIVVPIAALAPLFDLIVFDNEAVLPGGRALLAPVWRGRARVDDFDPLVAAGGLVGHVKAAA